MNSKNLVIENARIMFRNFSGRPSRFNDEGKRNFCVVIERSLALCLKEEGWNVRQLRPKDLDGEPGEYYIQVAVSYKNIPPTIMVIQGENQQLLDESTVGSLDWADIENVDLIIRPYQWDVKGDQGVKGYVKSMYVTLEEDRFREKYERKRDYEIPDETVEEDCPF